MKNLFLTLMSTFLLSGISLAQSVPQANKEGKISADYYKNSTIVFAEGVDMEKQEPINPKDIFNLKDGTVTVTIIVKLDKPFKTNSINVDIFYEYIVLEDSLQINIDEDQNVFSFTRDFQEEGKFNLELYNSDDVFIWSAVVEIE